MTVPFETARGRGVSSESDRGGARTHDQRINLPHRLSPTAGSAGPRASGVESLDYPTAVAGVPRLVSGAGTGDPPPPCLLMTQSPAFSAVTLAVTGDVVVSGALRASQHTAVFTLRGSVSSRGRLPFFRSKSVALPTELPGQGSLSLSPGGRLVQTRASIVNDPKFAEDWMWALSSCHPGRTSPKAL